MKHPQTGICREGCPFLALVAFSALLFALLGLWLPALAFLLVLWLSSHFFRDPERVCPQEGHCALRACLQTSYRSQISEAARHTKAAKTSASLS